MPTANTPCFRLATLFDCEAFCALEMKCFTTDLVQPIHFKRFIRSKSCTVLIVEDQQKLIGSAIILFRKNSKIARLYSIAIAPEAQGKGIAKSLCAKIESNAREHGCHEIRLEVRPDNTRAINLYQKLNYHLFGRYHQFYEDGTDALRLHKLLTQTD